MSDFSFEAAMKRIEEIAMILEKDNVSLNDSLKLYQEGMELSNKCYQILNDVEKQSIKILNENDINAIKERLDEE
ncbi:MAG: exodeoxyribonuclease VII small subunit [Bacilli bacterium]|jgi:exodeoxyribonuclease VII small subunit|nr:exodeoxyribonuclease VII small subunit [Bacilli bacterium]